MLGIKEGSSLNFQGQICPTWPCCCVALSVCYYCHLNQNKASPHQGGQDCSTNTFKLCWVWHLHFVQPMLQIIPFDWRVTFPMMSDGCTPFITLCFIQSMWAEMCLHMEFWYMCQSQAGNSNGVECIFNQINHLSTEEWHFLAITQLPSCFITHCEGKIPSASTQVLWELLGWVGLWLFCCFFLSGSFPNYTAFHALPWKPHSQYNPWAFPESL